MFACAVLFSNKLFKLTVKLHSKLADPTQLYLVGVGVDFVFTCNKNNPNLASAPCTARLVFLYLPGRSCGVLG